MWRKYNQIKKRRLEEEHDSSSDSDGPSGSKDQIHDCKRPLSYRNSGFKEADDSFSLFEPSGSDKRSQVEQIDPFDENESDQKKDTDTSWRANFSACHLNQSAMTDDLNQSCVSSATECMVDASFSYGESKCLIVSTESKATDKVDQDRNNSKKQEVNANGFKGFDDKIRKREMHLFKVSETKTKSTKKKHKSKKIKKEKSKSSKIKK